MQELYRKQWFRQNRFARLAAWTATIALLNSEEGIAATELEPWIDALNELRDEAFLAGYEVHALRAIAPAAQ